MIKKRKLSKFVFYSSYLLKIKKIYTGQLFSKLRKDTLASAKKQISKNLNWYPVTDNNFFKFNLISTKVFFVYFLFFFFVYKTMINR